MDGGRPRKRHAAAAEVLVPESGDSSTDDDDATESEDEAAVQAAVARLSRSPDSPDVVIVNEVTAADREAAARAAAVDLEEEMEEAAAAAPPPAAQGERPAPQVPDLHAMLLETRKTIAERDGKLPFHILTNDAVRELADNPVSTIDELKEIQGIGSNRASMYGKDLLKTIQGHNAMQELGGFEDDAMAAFGLEADGDGGASGGIDLTNDDDFDWHGGEAAAQSAQNQGPKRSQRDGGYDGARHFVVACVVCLDAT